MDDTRVCKICDGGPGNECACFCPDGPHYDPIFFYREENARWSDDVLAISVHIFVVVKFTPAGCWIAPEWDAIDQRFKRFVLDGKGKRYAYPTREEARASYIIRKQREIQKTAAQHDRAVRYLALAQTMKLGTRTEALHEIKTREILLPESQSEREKNRQRSALIEKLMSDQK